jgi:hypothetical protein
VKESGLSLVLFYKNLTKIRDFLKINEWNVKLIDMLNPLMAEMEGFIAHLYEEFLSIFSESSLGEEILLYDKAVEWERSEQEPLKKAYLRAVQKVFRFLARGELPKESVYGEFVKALSGMEEEKYSKLVEKRIMWCKREKG